ncbi:hypothetical protein NA29_20560 [Pandoraea sputorum]|nr:hypothetical protein NA29_20560 [Pandoraea sputorum]
MASPKIVIVQTRVLLWRDASSNTLLSHRLHAGCHCRLRSPTYKRQLKLIMQTINDYLYFPKHIMLVMHIDQT